MKNNKWIAINLLAVFSGISLLLQQFFLNGNKMSIWETTWFIMTIMMCFSYISYGLWIFFANPKEYYEIKPKSLPVISFVLIAVELAFTTACILSDEKIIFIIICTFIFAAENVVRISCTIKAVKGGVKKVNDLGYSRFVVSDTACTFDEEREIGFGVGVSILLAFMSLLPVISMGFENLKSLVISYHIILAFVFVIGVLCLNKLYGVTGNYQLQRIKLKILSGLLIFDWLITTAFVWILYYTGKDYFRALVVAMAIISVVQVLVFAAVPLSKLNMEMKYYLQINDGKTPEQKDNADKH